MQAHHLHHLGKFDPPLWPDIIPFTEWHGEINWVVCEAGMASSKPSVLLVFKPIVGQTEEGEPKFGEIVLQMGLDALLTMARGCQTKAETHFGYVRE